MLSLFGATFTAAPIAMTGPHPMAAHRVANIGVSNSSRCGYVMDLAAPPNLQFGPLALDDHSVRASPTTGGERLGVQQVLGAMFEVRACLPGSLRIRSYRNLQCPPIASRRTEISKGRRPNSRFARQSRCRRYQTA